MTRHLSLFSGIGGFDLAAEWMGWENVAQVENNPFCQKILKQHFPKTDLYADIKQFNGTKYKDTIDVISGGFPCQPFSQSGHRKGANDDRFLWPEMLRIIKEIRPTWVIGENVNGIIDMALDQVLSDLEAESYATRSFIIPACALNAPHRRDRVWIIAHSDIQRLSGGKSTRAKSYQPKDKASSEEIKFEGCIERNLWSSWKDELPSPKICRGNDGIPNQSHRIKALGNAIVPQVAYQIFKFLSI